MPSRSTICLSWTSAFQRPFLDSYCQVCPRGSTPWVCYDWLRGTLYMHFACGDIRWSYVSSNLQDISFYTDGHFLLCLLCPFTLTCFSLLVTD